MELSCTLLYCLANEVDKFIKSFQWFKDDLTNYLITEDHNIEYHKAVWELNNICYSYAYHLEYFEIVKYLISFHDPPPKLVPVDPIIICCIKNNIESVEKYISLRNSSGDKKNTYLVEDTTPTHMYIHVACYCNNIDLMKYLISNYVDENGENKYKLSNVYDSNLTFFSDDVNDLEPYWLNDIIIAAMRNNFNMVKLLLELYYDEDDIFCGYLDSITQNITTYLVEVIIYATIHNNINMVKQIFNLVENNKHVTKKTYLINFSNCIVHAINNNHIKLLRFLLTKYTQYDLIDILKNTNVNPNIRMFNIIIKSINVSLDHLYRIYLFQQYSENHMIKYFISLGIKPHILRIHLEYI